MTRIATADPDKVVTLFFEQRQCSGYGIGERPIAYAFSGRCNYAIAILLLRPTEQAQNRCVATFGCEHASGLPVSFELVARPFRREQLYNAGRNRVGAGSVQQRRIATVVRNVDFRSVVEKQSHSLFHTCCGG